MNTPQPQLLQLFPKIMKHTMPDQRGNDGDGEIGEGKDIAEGMGQSFTMCIGRSEFSHQEV